MDDNVAENGFWVCLECRMLPSRIKNIESILSKFVSKYEETELKLAEKITETAHLQDENIRLRQRLNTNEKENRSLEQDLLGETMKTNTEELREQNHGTLLTGSSIIRDINQKDFDIDTEPICIRGGHVSDITAALLNKPDNEKYDNIILQVGSNNCTNTFFNPEDFKDDFQILVKTAQSKCNNAVISSMYPRLDDKFGSIATGNETLSKIASDENCFCIDNDDCFRLQPTDSINVTMHNADGVHLNNRGTYKLAENLGIRCIQENYVNRDSKVGRARGEHNHAHRRKEHDSNSQVRSRHSDGDVRHNHQNVRRHNSGQSDRRNASYAQSNTYRLNGQKHYRRRYSHDDYVNSKSDVLCWYCGESNYVSKNCRHGDYILCS
jgi:regulator of replication initiation timing